MKFISAQDVYVLLVIALFRTCAWIPSIRLQNVIADKIGAIAYQCSSAKRKQSEASVLRVIIPRPSPEHVRRIVLSGFQQVWHNQLELWRGPDVSADIQVAGWEHLQTALDAGRGVIFLESNALGSGHLAKRILCQRGIRVYQVHGIQHLAGFHSEPFTWVRNNIALRVFEQREKRFVADIVRVSDSESLAFIKHLVGILQRNAVLCISGDGNVGHNRVQIPFLGQTRLFSTGMINLGKISGAALLPMFCLRRATGESMLVIEPPLEFDPNLGRDQVVVDILTRYAHLLDCRIRQFPGQYRNWHLMQSPEAGG
jgi:lauroyl/myristoyl acyltransferase